MDPRTRLFLCVLASVGFFAVLAGLFGALSGAATWRDGRAAGTSIGFAVARAFARGSDRVLSPGTWGALVGGTDGVVFGAVVGTICGLIAGWYGQAEWHTLRPILLGSILLVAAAVLFGLMAIGLHMAGIRSLLGLFLGGIAGALYGFRLAHLDGLLVGALLGSVLGTVLFAIIPRLRPKKGS